MVILAEQEKSAFDRLRGLQFATKLTE